MSRVVMIYKTVMMAQLQTVTNRLIHFIAGECPHCQKVCDQVSQEG